MSAPTVGARAARGDERPRGGWRGRGQGPARIEVRSRIALTAALAVALAVLLVSASAYVAVRHDLLSSVDGTLTSRAATLEHQRVDHGLATALDSLFQPATSLSRGPIDQVVESSGVVVAPSHSAVALPVTAQVRRVAAGSGGAYATSATIGATAVRLYVASFGRGLALELAQPVGATDAELQRLAVVLAVAAIAGVLLALLLGAGVAGVVLRPVRRLTSAAEQLAATRDLSQRIPAGGRDELSRLASSVNTLIQAVQSSQLAQRQLVADASHELRSPLTSLRTNVELLAGHAEMSEAARDQLLEDVVGQLDSLGQLVGDLIELARQEAADARDRPREVLELDRLVEDVLVAVRRNHPQVRVDHELDPVLVRGVGADLRRLVANLVDNAAKWSPDGGLVEVHLDVLAAASGPVGPAASGPVGPAASGPASRVAVLTVADEGRGIEARDLPHVFDRFFRGSGGQKVAGSGLGLAIVQRIVEAHGGSVSVSSFPGTGTRFTVQLPALGP